MPRTPSNYLERHDDAPSGRLQEIIDLQRGVIGNSVHLIASACYPFASVLQALAEPSFVLPVEGMPGARYLPGSKAMDLVEIEGEALALALFGSPKDYGANLQPHSGTQANQIVYNAVLEPGDTVLCLRPRDGGHISHTVLLGRQHQTFNYGLTDAGAIDYDHLRELARRERPKLIIVGGSALPRAIDFSVCGEIATECGAYLHADISHTATFVAAGVHPSAFPHCDFASFNTMKNLRGPNGGLLLFREALRSKIEASVFPVTQGGANETNLLAKFAVLLEWRAREIRPYASSIIRLGRLMAGALEDRELAITTGGTDCHIVLVEGRDWPMSGADLERQFEASGVLINRNLIPGDCRPPSQTSGLRIGVTNLAILGYEDDDVVGLSNWIADAILGRSRDDLLIPGLVQKYRWNPQFSPQ